jgi:hypothetical protein
MTAEKRLGLGGGGSGGGGSGAWCTASASWDATYSDYDVYVHSRDRPRIHPAQIGLLSGVLATASCRACSITRL